MPLDAKLLFVSSENLFLNADAVGDKVKISIIIPGLLDVLNINLPFFFFRYLESHIFIERKFYFIEKRNEQEEKYNGMRW